MASGLNERVFDEKGARAIIATWAERSGAVGFHHWRCDRQGVGHKDPLAEQHRRETSRLVGQEPGKRLVARLVHFLWICTQGFPVLGTACLYSELLCKWCKPAPEEPLHGCISIGGPPSLMGRLVYDSFFQGGSNCQLFYLNPYFHVNLLFVHHLFLTRACSQLQGACPI